MTTVHGRTVHFLIRPFRTYGSALAKRSAADGSSALNTRIARSAGSASAPAMTSSPRACAAWASFRCSGRNGVRRSRRSEEHTSELQSHHDLVCRLLLEKQKDNEYADCRKHNQKKEDG